MDQGITDINTIKVSVIMPVYNTEKYVEEALYSILNQTLEEIQIIVVNDGSKDNSLEVVNKIAASDKRIEVYSQVNKGQALARNLGLKYAEGQFIYFMDSDDVLDKNTLYTCYEKCIKEELDFVFFDAEAFSDEDDNIYLPLNYDRKGKIEDRVYTGLEMVDHLLNVNGYRVPPWLYFIRKSYLDELQLTFVPVALHEDQIFVAHLFVLAPRVAYIPEKYFRRRLRPNSVMTNKYSMRNIKIYCAVVVELQEFASDKGDEVKTMIHRILKYIFDPAIYNASILPFRERLAILKKCQFEFSDYVTFKTKLVLLFPVLIKIKAIFK